MGEHKQNAACWARRSDVLLRHNTELAAIAKSQMTDLFRLRDMALRWWAWLVPGLLAYRVLKTTAALRHADQPLTAKQLAAFAAELELKGGRNAT